MILVQEKDKQTRGEIQYKSIEFSKLYPFYIIQYPTGMGKTFVAINILDMLYHINKKIQCLILMPEIPLIENIKKEFIKFNKEYLLSNVDIICYASLHKVDYDKYNIIIADEMHHSFSDLRKDYLSQFVGKIDRFIGLSATVDDWKIRELESIFRKEFFIHRVTLKDAIDWGILATPTICCFKLKLNNTIKNCTYEFVRGKKEKRVTITVDEEKNKWKYIKDKKQYPDLQLIVRCTEKQKHDYLEHQADYFEERYINKIDTLKLRVSRGENVEIKDTYLKNMWLQSELQIKKFLAEIKTPIVKKFLPDLKDKRFLCFANSISQAEELACFFKGHSVSSKEKQSEIIINKFLNKEIDNLFAVNKLQEGLNVEDIQLCVLIQLGGQKREFIQKVGRALRNKENPEVYLFYYEGTKDEEYLNKAIANIGNDYILKSDYFYEL